METIKKHVLKLIKTKGERKVIDKINSIIDLLKYEEHIITKYKIKIESTLAKIRKHRNKNKNNISIPVQYDAYLYQPKTIAVYEESVPVLHNEFYEIEKNVICKYNGYTLSGTSIIKY